MVLDGALTLRHDPGGEVQLGRFGQTRFCGDVPTRSRGRATDFNLMLVAGADGFVEALHIPADIAVRLAAQEVFYIYKGEVAATFPDGKTVATEEGSVLIAHGGGAGGEISLTNLSPENETIVIRAGIFERTDV